MTGKREDAALIKRLERKDAVLELRKQGLSYRAIVERLEELEIFVSHQTVKTDVKQALAQLTEDNAETAEELRQLMMERYSAAIEGMFDGISKGDPQTVNAMVAVNKEIAKLLGLYAPERRDTRNFNVSVDMRQAVDMLKAAQEEMNATDIVEGTITG